MSFDPETRLLEIWEEREEIDRRVWEGGCCHSCEGDDELYQEEQWILENYPELLERKT